MGRSAGDPAGIDPPESSRNGGEPGDAPRPDTRGGDSPSARLDALRTVGIAQKQLLENVRRALGKLVTHTKVHNISIVDTGHAPEVSTNDLLDVVVPIEAATAGRLKIPVCDRPAGIPTALPGGGGVDLAAVVTVVSADSAVNAATTQAHRIDVAYGEPPSFEIPKPRWALPAIEAARVDLVLLGGDVRPVALDRVRTVATGSLPVDRLQSVVVTNRIVAETLQPMRLGVRSSLTRAYQIPLVRRSSIARRGPGLNLNERERLALVSKTALENVALIGLFRNVPVTAVSRLSVEEDAAELLIWLKPEAVRSPSPPKLVDLLIGRDTITGKMIQTVA